MLAIEGAIVTIDAMGCQRAIAQQIVDQKADHVLALKGNQSALRDDISLFVTERKARQYADTVISRHETVDGDHGRIETTTATVLHDIAWLQQRHKWPALKSVVVIDGIRETGSKTERETRLYISSLNLPADKFGPIVRSHWAIENSLHWVMDMVFRDDECRVRTENAPANSPPSNISQPICCDCRPPEIHSAQGEKSPPGTTTSSQASLPDDPFNRFPWHGGLHQNARRSKLTGQTKAWAPITIYARGLNAFCTGISGAVVFSQTIRSYFPSPRATH
ncbi:ISAs1 family transposase [Martelella soudanensis]|uniref:ISAs1 family transposase n=1 Tax=unclassified Martelella TaxID=2629616 RepID=UPI001FF05242|nr:MULTISPECIES: ISAs1 family transposase [unclassified Martelella]